MKQGKKNKQVWKKLSFLSFGVWREGRLRNVLLQLVQKKEKEEMEAGILGGRTISLARWQEYSLAIICNSSVI